MEPKEKNDGFENEKKKRETPLEQRLKVKEQELARFISANNNYKKKKEKLKKQLEGTVNIDEINNLNDKIKIAKHKLKELEEEKKCLLKIKNEHNKCVEEKEKIDKEIKNLEDELTKKKNENNEKNKNKNLNKKGNNNKYIEALINLTEEERKTLKNKTIQRNINNFWKRNESTLNNSNEEIKEETNNKKNKKFLNEIVSRNIQKEQQFKDKLNYAEKIRNDYLISNPNEKNDKGNKSNNNTSISNVTELPKIPLFNQNEKKVLLMIIYLEY